MNVSESNSILRRIAEHRALMEDAPGTWPAKRRLAAAIRELMDCICATDANEEELLAAAEQIEAGARRFAAQPRMLHPPGVAEMALAGGMEIFHDRSPLMGLSNPMAPPLELEADEEAGEVRGAVEFGNAYEGAPGCVHGGFLAAALDEALGMACIFSDSPGMTGEMTVRYLSPTPTKTPLRIEARLDRIERRKIYTSGEISMGDVVLVRATGLFISITRDKFSELRDAQEQRGSEFDVG
jgi:acyl-coenzyme A thioesterase PaaI-like protein